MTDTTQNHLYDLKNALERLDIHDHLCLIYDNREEQFAAVMPFIRIGLERGEKCIYAADDNTAEMVMTGMQAVGIGVEAALASGQLAIVSKRESYLREGFFDPDHMIDFLQQAADEADKTGFSALRVTGEMTWMLGGDPGVQRLMEYEAKLNYFFPANRALAICQYARRRFSPEVIKDVIATHPLVIHGGMVCKNFYYVPPDHFLGEDQPTREVERLLANIRERAAVDNELKQHQQGLEAMVAALKERTDELEQRNRELELMNRSFVNRELKMVALKERIKTLERNKKME
ncbi:MAG: MEDS domain-containing protein [Proteobacteria bacterium]|nr:MEDS domain-containing protein [Pseudomonadota bacterium]MBU1715281.1 MEDS domain-containing protein [Pseudomonadota bacterium]